MNRTALLEAARTGAPWDVIIIGGGATGLGSAVEAASRGHRTILIEQSDFAKGTSSRSTKLSHGGVRYLEQGNIKLVFGALRERGHMIKNAPHIVHPLAFVIPAYKWWDTFFYGFGLWFYEMLSGRASLGKSRILSKKETLRRLPTLNPEGLRGGILYMDGQFDDARLALTLAATFADLGGTPLNYVKVEGLLKENGRVVGVTARDVESDQVFQLRGKTVLNATGIFTDLMRKVDDPSAKEILSVSQGTHIMLDRSFLPGEDALMIPKTEDGRVLFAIPWHEHTLVGTTDLPVPEALLEPRATQEEIDFLLHHAAKYLSKPVGINDVLSIFSGQRPLVRAEGASSTAQLSRDHTIIVSSSGLISITGGKWTSYRHMAEDAVDHLERDGGLPRHPSQTEHLKLHGWLQTDATVTATVYGTDEKAIREIAAQNPELSQPLHPLLKEYTLAHVVWAARNEMARTVEDVLARRTRSLLLNARASSEAAPVVANLLAKELKMDAAWVASQISSYQEFAQSYVLRPVSGFS